MVLLIEQIHWVLLKPLGVLLDLPCSAADSLLVNPPAQVLTSGAAGHVCREEHWQQPARPD